MNINMHDIKNLIVEVQKVLKYSSRSLWRDGLIHHFKKSKKYEVDTIWGGDCFTIFLYDNLIGFIDDPNKKCIILSYLGNKIFVYRSNIRSKDMPYLEHLLDADETVMDIIQMEHELLWKKA